MEADGARPASNEILSPDTRRILAAAGRHYQEGHPLLALNVCLEGLAGRPNDARLAALAGSLAGETGDFAAAAKLLGHAARLNPDDTDILFNLGVALERNRDTGAATKVYRRAVAANAENGGAWFGLARLLQQDGLAEEALAAFRKVIEIEPGHPGARHMVSSLSGENPDAPPAGYVQALFDDYAQHFDEALVGRLEYRTPQMLRGALAEAAPGHHFTKTLDLGCGTGLAGAAVADITTQLDGVDLSSQMVEQARQRGIYATLDVGAIGDYLEATSKRGEQYDLIMAADVLVYLGDLERLFTSVATCLATNGLFAFSVENLQEGTYRLQPSGRYAHAHSYVATLAMDHGFKTVSQQSGMLRRDRTEAIDGSLWILSQPCVPA